MLSDKNPEQLYISSGEVHGFLTQAANSQAANSEVCYQMANCLDAELARGIDWQDHTVVIA